MSKIQITTVKKLADVQVIELSAEVVAKFVRTHDIVQTCGQGIDSNGNMVHGNSYTEQVLSKLVYPLLHEIVVAMVGETDYSAYPTFDTEDDVPRPSESVLPI